jgi:hypothetical protein
MPEQMGLDGPYLTIAVLCEKVLEEKDGVPSLIRIVERFNITGQPPSMQPTVISPMLVIGLKAGMFRGQAVIQVQPVPPSGEPRPALRLLVHFEGDDDRGVMVRGQLQFLVTEPGLYWFEIKLFDALLTKIPMRVVYLPKPSIVAGGTDASGPRL